MSVLTKGRNLLLVCGGTYMILLLSLIHPVVQREVFYLHNIKFPWRVDLRRPELSGFSADRAKSIFIGDQLHAWHIGPLSYLTTATPMSEVHTDSKLVIYLHGTAGTIAVPHRLTTYRLLSSLPDTHVLALDYRGFGLSAGKPTEAGLIEDGTTAVQWALDQGFDSSRITLFGQSLGSAVAIATAHNLATNSSDPVHVGHVVSVAGFSTARDIIKTYRVSGFIPVLGPLRTYPWIQNKLLDHLQHDWDSEHRVYELALKTDIRLTFAHATTDTEILCSNSEKLLLRAIAGADMKSRLDNDSMNPPVEDLYEEGSLKFPKHDHPKITYKELYWGSHNLVSWNDDLLTLL